ncbi:MAG: hypothetical protein LKI34_05795 [Bifidobacterium tibiigranuli]|jgi:hypothetical protein|uniref:hypothetical protein n=1 Tax=Bifidobacterium tibiigranuli TaxID=2172043 RepID=UPI0026EDED62|nr:hypothetical protein [Bifidobacterium tibiigranuli]MCI1673708.1 hypothetical protein [Bifidobacterium tibiigranuli]MCI1712964.1 hypothetical protein [Bifidobacterium tibiigranuli]MCI1833529.1 hypothetical protein [Bifidobacterium tibiigranuli]
MFITPSRAIVPGCSAALAPQPHVAGRYAASRAYDTYDDTGIAHRMGGFKPDAK